MRGSLTTSSLLVLAAGCIPSALGCIPSYRMVYEGDRYFERCYGADFDRRVLPAQNEACWQAWLAHYTRHQQAHRIDYAMRRVEALQSGEPSLELPGLQGRGAQALTVAPSQQVLLQNAQAGAQPEPSTASSEPSKPEIPNGCLEVCNSYEGRCVAECSADRVDCRQGCARERAICLGACH